MVQNKLHAFVAPFTVDSKNRNASADDFSFVVSKYYIYLSKSQI